MKAEKNVRRPRRGCRWVTTLKVYQPKADKTYEQQARCECPDCTWQPANLLSLHANEPPEPARLLPWCTPALVVELDAEDELAARLADGFRDGALLLDAFKWIASWQRFLPGLVKDSDDPIAMVLRIAFWLRNLHRVTSGDDPWTVDDLAEACRAMRPNCQVQRRALVTPGGDRSSRDAIVVPPEWRRIIARDIAATRQVVDYTYRFLLAHDLAVKGRWRAILPDGVSYVTSAETVKRMLEEGLSARDAGQRFGLSGSIVSRRFSAAVDAVAESLGLFPWPWRLSSQKLELARRVERRKQRNDNPRLWPGDLPAPLPCPWERQPFASPAKWVRPEDQWIIIQKPEYFGSAKVPAGCAADIIERYRSPDRVLLGDPDDDYSPTIGKTDTLRTESWYSLHPRATDWRDVARALPPGPERDAALERESTIARLLKEHWPRPAYWPSQSKARKRFSVSWQHDENVYYAPPKFDVPIRPVPPGPRLNTWAPRYDDIDDDNFAGAVVMRDGELVAQRYESGPKVKRDILDRFNAAIEREDAVPH